MNRDTSLLMLLFVIALSSAACGSSSAVLDVPAPIAIRTAGTAEPGLLKEVEAGEPAGDAGKLGLIDLAEGDPFGRRLSVGNG